MKDLKPLEFDLDLKLPVGEVVELHGKVGKIFFQMAVEGGAIACAARKRIDAKTIEWQNIAVYDEATR